MLDAEVADVASRNQTHDTEKRMRRSPCASGFSLLSVHHLLKRCYVYAHVILNLGTLYL